MRLTYALFARERRHRLITGLVVTSLMLSAVTLLDRSRTAEARVDTWKRISRTGWGYNLDPAVQNISLRSRGYIDDTCLSFLSLTCFTAGLPLRERPEATAQSILIRMLGLKHLDFNLETVDWEVGPGRDTHLAGNPAPVKPGEPEDPCDLDEPGPKVESRWRIDVATNRKDIFEVKRWENATTTFNKVERS